MNREEPLDVQAKMMFLEAGVNRALVCIDSTGRQITMVCKSISFIILKNTTNQIP